MFFYFIERCLIFFLVLQTQQWECGKAAIQISFMFVVSIKELSVKEVIQRKHCDPLSLSLPGNVKATDFNDRLPFLILFAYKWKKNQLWKVANVVFSWFKLDTSAQIPVYLQFDYSLSHQTGI